MNLDDSLRDKQITNGPFKDTSDMAQSMKMLMRLGTKWQVLPSSGKESLELIASHIAKILQGDHAEPKHWNDIATLARLHGKLLEPVKMPSTLSPEFSVRPHNIGLRAVENAIEEET